MTPGTFAEAIAATPIDLALAALLYAREIAYPDLQTSAYQERIEQLAVQAAQRVGTGGPAEQAEALGLFLFGEVGFEGNVDAYYDPANSYLNRVLDRRLGIPITLSVIYMAVAEQLGLVVHGVGLPGHFLVGVETGVTTAYFDPFHGGMRRSSAECARLVTQATHYQGPFEERWLQPISTKAILTRMLNNLVNAHTQRQEWLQAIGAVEHLQVVEPDEPTHVRDLGLLLSQEHQYRRACEVLETYLRLNPSAADAASVRQRIVDLKGRLARLN